MSDIDLHRHLIKGRDASHVARLDPRMAMALQRLFAAAPPNIRQGLMLNSGFRSVEKQADLYRKARAKYGSEAAARKWVALPGKSRHNSGAAMDMRFNNPAVRQWVHQNAASAGLHFPMKHEPWHVELIGSRGKGAAPPAASPAPGAANPPQAAPGAPNPMALAGAPPIPLAPAALDPFASLATMGPDPQMAAQKKAKAEDEKRRTALLLGVDPAQGLAGLF